jgi:phosphoribosylpyrophosphate synthetase
MAAGALDQICARSVRRIVTTNSVPSAPEPRLEVILIAPLFARSLIRLSGGE